MKQDTKGIRKRERMIQRVTERGNDREEGTRTTNRSLTINGVWCETDTTALKCVLLLCL